MKSLVEFQKELVRTLQKLGPEPTPDEVDAAGSELCKDGVPDGANLEGLLLVSDMARMRADKKKGSKKR